MHLHFSEKFKRYKKRNTGKKEWEDGGRDRSDASTSQGMPRMADNHQKWGKRHKTVSFSEPPERTNPAKTWILDI